MSDPTIVPVERLDFRLIDWKWPFAQERQGEIAAHFDAQQQANSTLWNGRIYMLRRYEISNAIIRGEFFETDFANLLAWRDWGYPDSVFSCFAMAAIESSDKGLMLGVMGSHTASAGKIYFPTGSPDAHDRHGDEIDLERSVRRELGEETGLAFEEFEAEPGWTVAITQTHVAVVKHLRSSQNAETVRNRVLEFLAREAQPELSDVRFYYAGTTLTSNVPIYVQAFLRETWRTSKREDRS